MSSKNIQKKVESDSTRKLKDFHKSQDSIPKLLNIEDDSIPEQKMDDYYIQLQNVFHEESGLKKQPIQIEEIFSKFSNQQEVEKVLIKGSAGMGKSTFLNYVSYRWGKGELFNNKFEYLFKVPLKELMNKEKFGKDSTDTGLIILTKLVLHQFQKQSTKVEITEDEIQKILSEGEKVCLLLDGYDEISSYYRRPKFKHVTKLIDSVLGYQFPKIHVLMTSRPNSIGEIQQKFKRLIENLGLDLQEAKNYIDKFFSSNRENGNLLKTILNTNTNLATVIKTPISLFMLCFVFSQNQESIQIFKGEFPISRLYEQTIVWMAKRYKDKLQSKTSSVVSAIKYLTVEDAFSRQQIKALKKLAYLKFVQGNYSIASSEIKDQFETEKEEQIVRVYKFGLLKAGGITLKDKKTLEEDNLNSRVFEFIHLSFQEFFAARYLADQLSLNDKAIYKFIGEHRNEPRYLMVMKFLSGMVNSEDEDRNENEVENSKGNEKQKSITMKQAFWQSILCNIDGKLQFGAQNKVKLALHLLGQCKHQLLESQGIQNITKARTFISNIVLKNVAQWQDTLTASGCLFKQVSEEVIRMLKEQKIKKNSVNNFKIASEIICSLIHKNEFRNAEIIDRLTKIEDIDYSQEISPVILRNFQALKGFIRIQTQAQLTTILQKLKEALLLNNYHDIASRILIQILSNSSSSFIINPTIMDIKKLLQIQIQIYNELYSIFQNNSQDARLAKKCTMSILGIYKVMVKHQSTYGVQFPLTRFQQATKNLFCFRKQVHYQKISDAYQIVPYVFRELVILIQSQQQLLELLQIVFTKANYYNVGKSQILDCLGELAEKQPHRAGQFYNVIKKFYFQMKNGTNSISQAIITVGEVFLKLLPSKVQQIYQDVKVLEKSYQKMQNAPPWGIVVFVGEAIKISKSKKVEYLKDIIHFVETYQKNVFKPHKCNLYASESGKLIIQEIKATDALSLLKPLIGKKTESIQEFLYETLSEIKKPSPQEAQQIVKILLEMFKNQKNPYQKINICKAVVKFINQLPSQALKLFEQFRSYMKHVDQNDNNRHLYQSVQNQMPKVIRLVIQSETLQKSLQKLDHIMKDENYTIRQLVPKAIAQMENLDQKKITQLMKTLEKTMQDEAKQVYKSSLIAYTKLKKTFPPSPTLILEIFQFLQSVIEVRKYQQAGSNQVIQIMSIVQESFLFEMIKSLFDTRYYKGNYSRTINWCLIKKLKQCVQPMDVMQRLRKLVDSFQVDSQDYDSLRYQSLYFMKTYLQDSPLEDQLLIVETLNYLEKFYSDKDFKIVTFAVQIATSLVRERNLLIPRVIETIKKVLIIGINSQQSYPVHGWDLAYRLFQDLQYHEITELLPRYLLDQTLRARQRIISYLITVVTKWKSYIPQALRIIRQFLRLDDHVTRLAAIQILKEIKQMQPSMVEEIISVYEVLAQDKIGKQHGITATGQALLSLVDLNLSQNVKYVPRLLQIFSQLITPSLDKYSIANVFKSIFKVLPYCNEPQIVAIFQKFNRHENLQIRSGFTKQILNVFKYNPDQIDLKKVFRLLKEWIFDIKEENADLKQNKIEIIKEVVNSIDGTAIEAFKTIIDIVPQSLNMKNGVIVGNIESQSIKKAIHYMEIIQTIIKRFPSDAPQTIQQFRVFVTPSFKQFNVVTFRILSLMRNLPQIQVKQSIQMVRPYFDWVKLVSNKNVPQGRQAISFLGEVLSQNPGEITAELVQGIKTLLKKVKDDGMRRMATKALSKIYPFMDNFEEIFNFAKECIVDKDPEIRQSCTTLMYHLATKDQKSIPQTRQIIKLLENENSEQVLLLMIKYWQAIAFQDSGTESQIYEFEALDVLSGNLQKTSKQLVIEASIKSLTSIILKKKSEERAKQYIPNMLECFQTKYIELQTCIVIVESLGQLSNLTIQFAIQTIALIIRAKYEFHSHSNWKVKTIEQCKVAFQQVISKLSLQKAIQAISDVMKDEKVKKLYYNMTDYVNIVYQLCGKQMKAKDVFEVMKSLLFIDKPENIKEHSSSNNTNFYLIKWAVLNLPKLCIAQPQLLSQQSIDLLLPYTDYRSSHEETFPLILEMLKSSKQEIIIETLKKLQNPIYGFYRSNYEKIYKQFQKDHLMVQLLSEQLKMVDKQKVIQFFTTQYMHEKSSTTTLLAGLFELMYFYKQFTQKQQKYILSILLNRIRSYAKLVYQNKYNREKKWEQQSKRMVDIAVILIEKYHSEKQDLMKFSQQLTQINAYDVNYSLTQMLFKITKSNKFEPQLTKQIINHFHQSDQNLKSQVLNKFMQKFPLEQIVNLNLIYSEAYSLRTLILQIVKKKIDYRPKVSYLDVASLVELSKDKTFEKTAELLLTEIAEEFKSTKSQDAANPRKKTNQMVKTDKGQTPITTIQQKVIYLNSLILSQNKSRFDTSNLLCRTFLKRVFHILLSDGDISEEDSKFIINCLKSDLTINFSRNGEIIFEDKVYDLNIRQNSQARRQFEEIVRAALEHSSELAEQFKKYKPYFINLGKHIEVSATDISEAKSITSTQLSIKSENGILSHVETEKEGSYLLAEKRNEFGDVIVYKIGRKKLYPYHTVHPEKMNIHFRERIFGPLKNQTFKVTSRLISLKDEDEIRDIAVKNKSATNLCELIKKKYFTSGQKSRNYPKWLLLGYDQKSNDVTNVRLSNIQTRIASYDPIISSIQKRLESSGVTDIAAITSLIEQLEKQSPNFGVYYKVFYWTLSSYFYSFKLSMNEMQSVDTRFDQESSLMEEGFKQVGNMVLKVAQGIPIIGDFVGYLDGIVDYLADTYYEHKFENKKNAITKIILSRMNNDGQIDRTLQKTTLEIMKNKKEQILYPTEQEQNSIVQDFLNALQKECQAIKSTLIENEVTAYQDDNIAAKMATMDAMLVLAHMYKNSDTISNVKSVSLYIQLSEPLTKQSDKEKLQKKLQNKGNLPANNKAVPKAQQTEQKQTYPQPLPTTDNYEQPGNQNLPQLEKMVTQPPNGSVSTDESCCVIY